LLRILQYDVALKLIALTICTEQLNWLSSY